MVLKIHSKIRATPITTPICVGVAMGDREPPLFKSLDPALSTAQTTHNIN